MIYGQQEAAKTWRATPRDLFHIVRFHRDFGYYSTEAVMTSVEEAASEVLTNDDAIAVYKITIDGLRVTDPADVSADVARHLIKTGMDHVVPSFMEASGFLVEIDA